VAHTDSDIGRFRLNASIPSRRWAWNASFVIGRRAKPTIVNSGGRNPPSARL
jgi:hypothetical protein